ncbi:hypothetical protein IPL68_01835 [Candidatus Saccharibacteria bacterium]|nr:MAG: hypothetical protein IPL68_01835 [Candidatus Saccharibacteria bacterium]
MPNHIHLFVYQHDEYAIRDFMRALLTSYCMQYNKVHKSRPTFPKSLPR